MEIDTGYFHVVTYTETRMMMINQGKRKGIPALFLPYTLHL